MKRFSLITENSQTEIKLTCEIERAVKKAIKTALKYENVNFPCEISLTYTNDEDIHSLNRQFRGIDCPTDVLSFPQLDEIPESSEIVLSLGDIVISLERAKKQAEKYGHSLKREVCFLAVHSVLHLLGYDHETSPEDEKDMFDRQKKILEIAEITE